MRYCVITPNPKKVVNAHYSLKRSLLFANKYYPCLLIFYQKKSTNHVLKKKKTELAFILFQTVVYCWFLSKPEGSVVKKYCLSLCQKEKEREPKKKGAQKGNKSRKESRKKKKKNPDYLVKIHNLIKES